MEAVIAAGAQDVETPLTQGRIPGDIYSGTISTAVHIPLKLLLLLSYPHPRTTGLFR